MPVLTFHSWMEQVGGSTITGVSGKFQRETVLSVHVANPISLKRLTELRLVAGFVEQRNASSETDARGENELGEAKGNAGPTDEPRRFWVVLNRSPEPDSKALLGHSRSGDTATCGRAMNTQSTRALAAPVGG